MMETTAITRYRQVWTRDALAIPGLILLGHYVSNRAAAPLAVHTHPGALEFVAVIRGGESYFVDGKQYPLSGGDVFVSFADQPHSNGDAPQGVSEFIWFQIDPRPADLLGLSTDRARCLQSRLLALDTHVLKADRECLSLLKKSLAAFLWTGDSSREYGCSLFVSGLMRLLLIGPSASGDDMAARAATYIDAHMDSPIALNDLASLWDLSLSGFKHQFKQGTGCTPRDFINRRKIEKARLLLRRGLSVTETAMALGFNSSDYFSVVFKKYTNLTPRSWAANDTAETL